MEILHVITTDQAIQCEALFWHYLHYHPLGATPYSLVRKDDLKLIRFFEYEHYELYNLREDISEKNDLSSTYSEKVEK